MAERVRRCGSEGVSDVRGANASGCAGESSVGSAAQPDAPVHCGRFRWTDPGRRARAGVLAALRSELEPRVDRVQLDTALHDAVTLDEMMLLPPRQRFALWAATLAHETVDNIVGRTGWTPGQVARLLRVALQTVTTHARI